MRMVSLVQFLEVFTIVLDICSDVEVFDDIEPHSSKMAESDIPYT